MHSAMDRDEAFDIAILAVRVTGAAMMLGGIAIALGIGNLFIPEVGILVALLGLFEFWTVPIIVNKIRDRHQDDLLSASHPGNKDQR